MINNKEIEHLTIDELENLPINEVDTDEDMSGLPKVEEVEEEEEVDE